MNGESRLPAQNLIDLRRIAPHTGRIVRTVGVPAVIERDVQAMVGDEALDHLAQAERLAGAAVDDARYLVLQHTCRYLLAQLLNAQEVVLVLTGREREVGLPAFAARMILPKMDCEPSSSP